MKKLFLILGVLGGFYCVNALEVNSSVKPLAIHHTAQKDWVKSKSGVWMGKDKIWYKLDKKDKNLWVSLDKKEWKEATNGEWTDKSGDLIKIKNNNLVWTTDGGNTWTPVPGWKWEGGDGVWYQFDTDWILWEKRSK